MSRNLTLFIGNMKWVYLGKIMAQIVNVLAAILVIRKLDIPTYGEFQLLLSTYFVFHVIGLSALINVSNRFVPEFIANDDTHSIRKLLLILVKLLSVIILTLSLVLYLLRNQFGDLFNIDSIDTHIIILLTYILVNSLKVLSETICKDLLLNKQLTLVSIFILPCRFILYLVFMSNLDVVVLMYIECTVITMNVLINSFIVLTKINSLEMQSAVESNLDMSRINKYLAYSFINEFGVGLVGSKINIFIVSALGNPAILGTYAVANKINNLVFKVLPVSEVKSVIRPIFFRKFSVSTDKKSLLRTKSFMVKFLLPVYLLPVLSFFLFGKFLIDLVFGNDYIVAYPFSLILLSTNVLIAIFFPLGLTAFLQEKLNYVLFSKLALLISIPFAIILFERFGLYAVVWANFIGNLGKNILLLFLMKRDGYQSSYLHQALKPSLSWLIFTLVFSILIGEDISMIRLIISAIVFIFSSILLFYLVKLFNKDEMKIILSFFRKNRFLKKIERNLK